jgi:hypothetical protein
MGRVTPRSLADSNARGACAMMCDLGDSLQSIRPWPGLSPFRAGRAHGRPRGLRGRRWHRPAGRGRPGRIGHGDAEGCHVVGSGRSDPLCRSRRRPGRSRNAGCGSGLVLVRTRCGGRRRLRPGHGDRRWLDDHPRVGGRSDGWGDAVIVTPDSPRGRRDCIACHAPEYAAQHGSSTPTRGCETCHADPNDYSEFTCFSCHQHSQDRMDDKHSDVSGYSYDSAACYSCHPDGREP